LWHCQDRDGEIDKPGRGKTSWENEDAFWQKVVERDFVVDLNRQDPVAGRWTRALKQDCLLGQ
jgi:hypothetical protein